MELHFRSLSNSEDENIYEEVSQLFKQMYDHMNTKGLVHTLTHNGARSWIEAIKKSLGKLNIIVVAFTQNEIVGFAAGNIRLLPGYLGGGKIGYISHVFVLDSYKKQRIGKQLVNRLEDSFKEKSVNTIELEVLIENHSAHSFWKKMGYKADNLRMIK